MSYARRPALRLGALVGAAAIVLAAPAPAFAHGDRDRIQEMRQTYSADVSVPQLNSGNVSHVSNQPGQVGISGCFMKTDELFVTSGLDSVKVFDVSTPTAPQEVGVLPSAQFENEAMNCGERKTKDGVRRFALVGVDLYQASEDIQHVNVGGDELVLVDVTDPTEPRITSRVASTTSTHTVACLDEFDCTYAYSAGNSRSGTFSIFDLSNLAEPKELDSDADKPGTQPFSSPTAGHKWNFDDAGFGTHTGVKGSSIFDVSQPRQPKLITTTGAAGRGEDPDYPGYNDFIHHNSQRPNADAFRAFAEPSVANGNVLLVTEEDYEQTDCSKAGSFQTWKVQTLDGKKDAIVPLDKVELADLGSFPAPQGAFCSAHWFDYHPSGIVTIGYYGGGMQLIDVRDPKNLKPYGHAVSGLSEVWDSYWVPTYNKNGTMTHRKTNLVYAVDLIRGLDVYAVDLPGADRLAAPAQLGAGNPFTTLSWPRDGLALSLMLASFAGVVITRRRVRVRA